MSVAIPSRKLLLFGAPGWILPGAAVDLNFAAGLSYPAAVSSLLSTSRASTGYAADASGNLILFGNNVPRITNLGLLVEEARANLNTQSGDFTNAAWGKNLSGAVTGVADPFGGTLGATITATATTGFHGVSQTQGTETASTAYTHSVFVKQGTAAYAVVGQSADTPFIWGTLKWSDLSLSNNGFCTVTLDPITYAGGYRRLSITYTRTATGNNTMLVGPGTVTAASIGNANYSYAAAGTETLIAIGAQSETGAFVTSYIPTTTVAVARAADQVGIVGAALAALQTTNGSIIAQTNTIANGTGAASPSIIGANAVNSWFLRVGTATALNSKLSGVTLATTAGSSGNYQTGRVKSGVAWSASGRSIVANAGTVATDSNVPSSVTSAFIGSVTGGTDYADGLFERVTIFNSRLPDATLKAMTQ